MPASRPSCCRRRTITANGGWRPISSPPISTGAPGVGRIASRIGISAEADVYSTGDDLFDRISARLGQGTVACVLVDEAQWMTPAQVWQLARAVDDLDVPVMCYGLRTDFRGELFPGSATLMALADEMREVRTICHCGKKATMVIRIDSEGRALTEGAQVEVGGNDRYVSLCRRHWREAVRGGADPIARRGCILQLAV